MDLTIDLSIIITERLKYFKKLGYHVNFCNAGWIGDSLKCDCCGRTTWGKYSYECDYPNNPNIGLCGVCCDEFALINL